jgi:PTS system nitrogen regulatory IIA component
MRNELIHVLTLERVLILESKTKRDALLALTDCLGSAAEIKDHDALVQGIFYREELMSTGIGMGIAVPHIRLASVTQPVMSAGLCRNPITDYQSLDGIPIHLIFMIAAGQNQHAEYLKLLSSLSLKLKNENLRNSLISAPDTQTFYNTLVSEERPEAEGEK